MGRWFAGFAALYRIYPFWHCQYLFVLAGNKAVTNRDCLCCLDSNYLNFYKTCGACLFSSAYFVDRSIFYDADYGGNIRIKNLRGAGEVKRIRPEVKSEPLLMNQ